MLARCTRLSEHAYLSSSRRRVTTAVTDARWPGWEVVVGIEVHAQIKSRRKLFSGKYPGKRHIVF
jgi:aspartyl-tRNA(Asn)/glutamyl-tRNA(Gln) amidotransferase subunit B